MTSQGKPSPRASATKASGLIVDPACPLTSLDLATVKNVRARMRGNQFEPLAIHSPWSLACDAAGAGKAPLGRDWQCGQPDFRLFGNHPKWSRAGSNTGVLLGFGPVPVQAFDFDIDDAQVLTAVLDAIKGILPKRLIVRTRPNSARIAALARCEAGALKEKLQGENGAIERLAKGQQVVVHGVHPTGVSLEWRAQRSPWNTRAADLSFVDEATVNALFAAIVNSGALGRKLDRTSARASQSGLGGPSGDIAKAFAAYVEKSGSTVRAVDDFFRDVGKRGTFRHDSLVSVAGALVRRGWTTKVADQLLTSSTDRWFGDGSWSKEVGDALRHAERRQQNAARLNAHSGSK